MWGKVEPTPKPSEITTSIYPLFRRSLKAGGSNVFPINSLNRLNHLYNKNTAPSTSVQLYMHGFNVKTQWMQSYLGFKQAADRKSFHLKFVMEKLGMFDRTVSIWMLGVLYFLNQLFSCQEKCSAFGLPCGVGVIHLRTRATSRAGSQNRENSSTAGLPSWTTRNEKLVMWIHVRCSWAGVYKGVWRSGLKNNSSSHVQMQANISPTIGG